MERRLGDIIIYHSKFGAQNKYTGLGWAGRMHTALLNRHFWILEEVQLMWQRDGSVVKSA